MKIKRYAVNTIEDVQELIQKDLGPHAVILTSRQIKYKGWKSLFFRNKVEVVAAAEGEKTPDILSDYSEEFLNKRLSNLKRLLADV